MGVAKIKTIRGFLHASHIGDFSARSDYGISNGPYAVCAMLKDPVEIGLNDGIGLVICEAPDREQALALKEAFVTFLETGTVTDDIKDYILDDDFPGKDAIEQLWHEKRADEERQWEAERWWTELDYFYSSRNPVRRQGPDVRCYFWDAEDHRYVSLIMVLKVEVECRTEWVIGLTRDVREIITAHLERGNEKRFLATLHTYSLPGCPLSSRLPFATYPGDGQPEFVWITFETAREIWREIGHDVRSEYEIELKLGGPQDPWSFKELFAYGTIYDALTRISKESGHSNDSDDLEPHEVPF
jgi:hypothetical protein